MPGLVLRDPGSGDYAAAYHRGPDGAPARLSGDSTDVQQACRELTRCHEQSQIGCDENGEPNPWFSSNPAFVWGVMHLSRREPRSWLGSVEPHFRREPELVNDTRQRLLAAGKSYHRR